MPDLMLSSDWLLGLLLFLVLARWVTEQVLARLNESHVRAHAGAVPEPYRDLLDATTYARTVDYTLTRSRWGRVESTLDAVVLLALLLPGVLPRAYDWVTRTEDPPNWLSAAAIFLILLIVSLLSLPFAWNVQFRIESRFGFNTTTPGTWWADRFKGLVLSVVLGYPLLLLILALFDWIGPGWWLWAWAAVLLFQVVMMVLAPVLILPLFNRFTPLPDGSLRTRLLGLAARCAFPARNILVMDGSRRSRHSNAFFTGFGRLRRIVLFDTLLEQLDEPELEAVLAHEIAHYKLGHVPQRLLAVAVGSFALFWLLGQLAANPWVHNAFGFTQAGAGPLLLVAILFGGLLAFWLGPIFNAWSRHHEYQADRFACRAVEESEPLVRALRKLTRENLSNLTPHPLYSGFHYSHPTLMERERALGIQESRGKT